MQAAYLTPWNPRAVYGAAVVLIYLSRTPFGVHAEPLLLVWAVFQTLPPCAKSLVPRLSAHPPVQPGVLMSPNPNTYSTI